MPHRRPHWICGTGFSREDVGLNTINSAAWLQTLSRLKPVLHWIRDAIVGPALAGGCRFEHHQFCGVASDAFPAEAGPTMDMRCLCGTGFSREDVGLSTINSAVWRLALSRLKPVLQWICGAFVGPTLAGRCRFEHHYFCGVAPAAFPAEAGPTMDTRCLCGTGFSREDVGLSTINSAVWRLTLSRLKPVLQVRGPA